MASGPGRPRPARRSASSTSTYETITAYLEAKNQPVKDAFLEEYVSNLDDPADPNLEINVYVQPR